MKKENFKSARLWMLLALMCCFATTTQAYVEGSDTFCSGTIAELEPGEYYIYYTDAQGVDRFLYAAGDNNWIVTDEPKSVEITQGNVVKDDTSGAAYAKYAYHINSFGYFMSNCASSDEYRAIIKTEPIDGFNARRDRCWESQVFYRYNSKYAIRLTNCNTTEWGANRFANTTGDQAFASLPSLGDALYVWNVVDVYDLGDMSALIKQAKAFITSNPTIQYDVLTSI